ncbi:SIMPL domain-containing protein, partial [Candidatus Falkowbacteria bacterium]|nr:SIMPL domain-containing protein [Candidatus Falkowbacteria bacterium]
MKKAHVFLITLGVLVLAAVAIVAVVMTNKSSNEDRFSVNGSGTVYAKADIANMNVGLKTEVKKTAAEATKENSDQMNEILVVLKDLGIEAKDIKTGSYSLNPVYNWTEKDGQKLSGYEVYQSVTLKIRDLEKIGDIIAKTTEKGANQVGGIS